MPEVPSTAKKPEDHKSSTGTYVWTSPDGREVVLTPFDRLPSGVFRKSRGMNELDSTFAIIEAATDEAGLSVIDDLPVGDLDQLFAAWSEESGTSVPQS